MGEQGASEVEPTVEAEGLIDTDILIDASHAIAPAMELIAAQRAEYGAKSSIVSAMELLIGCRDQREMAATQRFLERITVLTLSPQASRLAFGIVENYRLSHGMQMADAFIAATAIKRRLVLYTRNLRHFQMIAGLQVVRPY